jgi:Type IV secretion system pilin
MAPLLHYATPVLHLFRLAADCNTNHGFLPGLFDGITCDPTDGTFTINSLQDILTVVANVSRILIALAGGVAVIIIIVAAIFYITSGGDPGRIKRAKDILMNMTIGLLLILTAYTIVTFIAGEF